MKTTHKIAGARAMYRVVRAGRAMLGRTDRDVVVRGGINYELDLSQGIDFAIYLGNIYERQTKAALRRLVSPGSLVLDIGANIGAHTLHLASLVGPTGRVMAFEPTDYAFGKLRRNLRCLRRHRSFRSPGPIGLGHYAAPKYLDRYAELLRD